jgi:hypothetical protein
MKKLLVFLFSLWTGAATAGVPCSLPFNLQNNTVADATQVMANYNALVTCLGNAAASGANSDITGLFGLTSPLGPTFGGANTFYGGSAVGTNSLAVTVLPNTFTLTTGFMVSFTVGTTNTAATTLTVNGGATTNLFRATPTGPVAMTGGELVAGNRALAGYDGTQWQLLSQVTQVGGYGPLTTLASAATTDLGTISSHNIQVTGSATITSFGSSAILAYPIYRLEFTGAATLTNSGTLFLPGGANIVTANGDTATMLYLGSGTWQMLDYSRFTGQALVVSLSIPTVQSFTTGSGTYTPTAGTKRNHVRMCAGGGGGAASATNAGGTGGTSTLGAWTVIGGSGGTVTSLGGIGGTGGVNGTGTLVVRTAGGSGGAGTSASTPVPSGNGGAGIFGGGAGGTAQGTGQNAATPCAGGAGGGNGGVTGAVSGGGGAGEGVEFWVLNPVAVSYAVGGAGSGGAAGAQAGGNGAAGIIVIEEFPQ